MINCFHKEYNEVELVRLKIEAMTASFRYPRFMIGYHPTFGVPPTSTIYGILSAAKGSLVTPEDTELGYVFEYQSKFVDLETFYQLEAKNIKRAISNVMKRQQLFNVTLWLYVRENIAKAVLDPKYPLFLGRSSDLAVISSYKKISLEHPGTTMLGKTCLPFVPETSNRGVIQALPTYFTLDIPRKPVGVRQFYLTDEMSLVQTTEDIYHDPELDWGVYVYSMSILANN